MATRIDDAIVLSLATQQPFPRFPHFSSAWATTPIRGREKGQPHGHPRCPDSAVEATTRRMLLYTHCLELCGCHVVSGAHLRAGSPVIIPISSRTFLGIPASTNPAGRSRSLQLPIAGFIPIFVLLAPLSLCLCARDTQDVITGKTSGCCL
jgi:hypothetical protein